MYAQTYKHTKTYKCMHKRTLKSEHTAKNWTDDAGGDLTNAHSDLTGEGTLLPLMVKETFPLCLVRKKRKEECEYGERDSGGEPSKTNR